VDPTPCYPADIDIIKTYLRMCEELFPLKYPPHIFVIDRENLGRTSATTHHEEDHYKKDEYGRGEPMPWVIFYGKRIMPHPGMVRYLTAHEYGHVVEGEIARRLYTDPHPSFKLLEEYRKLRGLPEPQAYGPGTWHLAPQEVFACDFRILIAQTEVEFWPHPGVKRPEEVPEIQDWWKARQEEARHALELPAPQP
jgi:hypothetical protein